MVRLPSILVLGGGPDAEREISLLSSKAVADALAGMGHTVEYRVIERVNGAELAAMPGEVIFPVLHGGWGEGGPLQEIMKADGRPFVGCEARAARLAMDKMATKLVAARLGVLTALAAIVNAHDPGLPLAAPAVFKPVHEGSSVGLHVCRDADALARADAAVRADMREHPWRVYMLEEAILGGRELTVGILGQRVLQPIEIRPAKGVYDYQAKYFSGDTQYVVGPSLPGDMTARIQRQALAIFEALGGRHLARVDFILGTDGVAYLLEVNTMPGFTSHSLVPKAAAKEGIEFGPLCELLVRLAIGS